MKLFVEEATKTSLKRERALASLRTRRKLAVLHYAPIATTVVGEPRLQLAPPLLRERSPDAGFFVVDVQTLEEADPVARPS